MIQSIGFCTKKYANIRYKEKEYWAFQSNQNGRNEKKSMDESLINRGN